METKNVLNKFSKILTQSKSQGASQAMLYALKLNQRDMTNPQIGIASMGYDGNPCNNHLNSKAQVIKKSINSKNRMISFVFNTVGVSDGISMGTNGMNWSLPSRELICDSIETSMNAHHYDGNICIPGCDKNIPGSLMAIGYVNRPSIMLYGGSIEPGYLNNTKLDIVSAFQSYSQYKTNQINDKEREKIIKNCCPGSGSCGGMYTANTMASMSEVMGLTLPNSSSYPAMSKHKFRECELIEEYMYNLLKNDIKPKDIVTRTSIENAIKIGVILGGSTNLVLHIIAIADAFDIKLTLDDFVKISNDVPVLSNLKPLGTHLMNDLHNIGGLSVLIKYLINNNIIDGNTLTITGTTLWGNVKNATNLNFNKQNVIYPLNNSLKPNSHIRILKGNIAPDGSVAKISGNEGEYFKGRAKVYNDEISFLNDIDNLHKGSVVVLRYLGPKGGPGMPEMLKPTSYLVGSKLEKDIALITDGRFSGGSSGFIIGHVSPEAYVGGVIGLIEDDDLIEINAKTDTLNLLVNEEEIIKRKNKWTLPNDYKQTNKNYLVKYQKLVSSASNGCLLK